MGECPTCGVASRTFVYPCCVSGNEKYWKPLRVEMDDKRKAGQHRLVLFLFPQQIRNDGGRPFAAGLRKRGGHGCLADCTVLASVPSASILVIGMRCSLDGCLFCRFPPLLVPVCVRLCDLHHRNRDDILFVVVS
ncbi:unnamed protein product [Pylaiella littoralis]